MVVAIKDQPVPLDDLVLRGVEWVREGLPAAQAAEEVANSMTPDTVAYEKCYRRGLAEFIQAAVYLNASKAETPMAKQVRAIFREKNIASQPPRPSRVKYLFLDKPLVAADGRVKLLRYFNANDLSSYSSLSRARGNALIRTADMAERARAMLEEYGVEVVGQLPDSALAELDKGDWQ